MKNSILSNMTPCILAVYQRFGRPNYLHLHGRRVSQASTILYFLFANSDYSSTLRMEAVLSDKVTVNLYWTTLRHFSGNDILHILCSKSVKLIRLSPIYTSDSFRKLVSQISMKFGTGKSVLNFVWRI
jgi:hypothetical protein